MADPFDEPQDALDGDPGPADKPPKRSSSSSSSSSSSKSKSTPHNRKGRRKQQAQETIEELVELVDELRGRGSSSVNDDLADIARRDAGKMAEWMASFAERFAPFGFVLDNFLGAGGPLSAFRAFGPFVRKLLQSMREIRRERDELAADFARRLMEAGSTNGQEPEPGTAVELEGAVWEYVGGGQWRERGPVAA
jgi:hypothetical protein